MLVGGLVGGLFGREGGGWVQRGRGWLGCRGGCWELLGSNGIELLAIPHNANMSDGLMYEMNTFKIEHYIIIRMKSIH